MMSKTGRFMIFGTPNFVLIIYNNFYIYYCTLDKLTNYLLSWYVVQNSHCGFLSSRYDTVTMMSSKSKWKHHLINII